MKDWEILSILSNVALNHRLADQRDLAPEQWGALGLQLIDKPEAPEDALAPGLFSLGGDFFAFLWCPVQAVMLPKAAGTVLDHGVLRSQSLTSTRLNLSSRLAPATWRASMVSEQRFR
jgi:hypothetical protein